MLAMCVDDEKNLLNALARAVKKAEPITETVAFEDELDAIDWARTHEPDLAFLDIQLHTMDGLTLAKKLREMHPAIAIVFCTGYERYAVDVLKMHIDAGYLIKPVRAKAVQEEVEHILGKKSKALLTAVCFGDFEAYADGRPLLFKRKRAKELLAFLIDRKGAGVSVRRLAAALLPEQSDDKKSRNIVYQAALSLAEALDNVGAGKVLVSSNGSYAVDATLIDCDYYQALAGDVSATGQFRGEYMSQYAWANETCAYLESSIGGTWKD